jgi:hypothetical protein
MFAPGAVHPRDGLRTIAGVDQVLAAVASFHRARHGITD